VKPDLYMETNPKTAENFKPELSKSSQQPIRICHRILAL